MNYGNCVLVLLGNSHILLFDVHDIMAQGSVLSSIPPSITRTNRSSSTIVDICTSSSSSSISDSRSIFPFAKIITNISHPCFLLIDSTTPHWINYWNDQQRNLTSLNGNATMPDPWIRSSDGTINSSNITLTHILDRLWIIGSTGDAVIIDMKDIQHDIDMNNNSNSLSASSHDSTTLTPRDGPYVINAKYLHYWKYRGHSLTTNAVSVFPTVPHQPLFDDAYQIMENYGIQYQHRQGDKGNSNLVNNNNNKEEELSSSFTAPPSTSSSSSSSPSLNSYLYTFGTGTLVSRYIIPDERGILKEDETGITDHVVKIATQLITSTAVNILRIVTKRGPLQRLSRWFGSNEDENVNTGNETNISSITNEPISAEKDGSSSLSVVPPRSIDKEGEFQDSIDRTVTNTLLDPTGQYMVCVTTHGRVLLLQANDMSIVRLWKGYRQAQVGFIPRYTASSVTTRTDEEIIPCLVIYTSVRGTIDIWPLNRNGARIATIKVTKNGYLCYQPVAPSFRWGKEESSTGFKEATVDNATSTTTTTTTISAFPLMTLFISRERIRNLSAGESNEEEATHSGNALDENKESSASNIWITEVRCR